MPSRSELDIILSFYKQSVTEILRLRGKRKMVHFSLLEGLSQALSIFPYQ